VLGNIEEIYMKEASKLFQLQYIKVKRSSYLSIQTLDICLNPNIQDYFQKGFESIESTDTSSEMFMKKHAK
jgi:hypothetical protein